MCQTWDVGSSEAIIEIAILVEQHIVDCAGKIEKAQTRQGNVRIC